MGRPQSASPTRGSTRPENLIRRAHSLLGSWGLSLPPGKVSRLVREYQFKAEPRGIAFDQYLLGAVNDVSDHRARQAAGRLLGPDEKSGRPTAHSDHATGERATWNVFVERDLPRLQDTDEQPVVELQFASGTGAQRAPRISVEDLVPDPDELADITVMASVSDSVFEDVLAEARAEGDLSRANVVRKCKAFA